MTLLGYAVSSLIGRMAESQEGNIFAKDLCFIFNCRSSKIFRKNEDLHFITKNNINKELQTVIDLL